MKHNIRAPILTALLLVAAAPAWCSEAGPDASAAGEVKTPQKAAPLFEFRELYALGHFGNSYEVMGNNEFRELFAEMKSWGFNSYGDWFNMDDCKDPFEAGHLCGLGEALWDAKKEHYAIVQRLGLSRTLNFHPNHVYLTQCLPELLAERVSQGTKQTTVHGQLICPSIPEARALILKNHENIFRELARSGVQLNSLMSCPYDYGGCRCAKCEPWILTHAKLAHEIYQLARKQYPQVKMNMMGWWLTAKEHQLFADWVDANAPGWIDLVLASVPYGESKVPDVPLPKGSRRGAFLHISYAEKGWGDKKHPRRYDIYAHYGPVIAADRIEQTVANMKAQGVVGFTAYSEGVFDDVNKALLAGLASGQYETAGEVLEAYARRYFGADAETAKQWAAWLRPWGNPFDVDLRQSAATLETLLKKTPADGWRLRQWVLKQQLLAANLEIENGQEWTPERLEAVERFWAIQEKLHRGLYGLSPMRHCLGRRYTPTSWFKSWAEYKAAKALEAGREW
jgi:hypothetical protein